jgi:hypothetical protein
MVVKMLATTNFNGLKTLGNEYNIPDFVAKRWIKNKIATVVMNLETEKGGGEIELVYGVRNNSGISNISGDSGGEPSEQQRKTSTKSKRTDKNSNT